MICEFYIKLSNIFFGWWWGRASSFVFLALAMSVGKKQMCLTERWLFFSLQVTDLVMKWAGLANGLFPPLQRQSKRNLSLSDKLTTRIFYNRCWLL
ncbi:hypothetical protein MED217_12049 [Leeuwenhoekiella blandensis MED217]|uniref:Uncharacterized protein n=1 Tax=Leeuwenhoekiella blandensis (strain CECT 7118 / CCUG 51940 / KCTC 22103 / MED217) TaxID=398720 RepID=A3XLI4_LEEBM|nr:hypothetical protein MED217_12049 [Leeuwenhoekiella blandensis MED217]